MLSTAVKPEVFVVILCARLTSAAKHDERNLVVDDVDVSVSVVAVGGRCLRPRPLHSNSGLPADLPGDKSCERLERINTAVVAAAPTLQRTPRSTATKSRPQAENGRD